MQPSEPERAAEAREARRSGEFEKKPKKLYQLHRNIPL